MWETTIRAILVYGRVVYQEYLAWNKQTNNRNNWVRSGSRRKRGQWNEVISVLLMTNPHANCTNQSQQLRTIQMLNHIIISKVHCLHIFNHCSALLAIVLGICENICVRLIKIIVFQWDTPFPYITDRLLGYSGHTFGVELSDLVCTFHAFWMHLTWFCLEIV